MSRSGDFHDETGQPRAQQWSSGDRTFVYVPPDHPMNWHGKHVLSVHHKGDAKGNMMWDQNGRVDWVGIDPREQRQGHGSALWEAGQSLADREPAVPRPLHSETQTEQGQQWAKKVGGKTVESDKPKSKWTITVEDE